MDNQTLEIVRCLYFGTLMPASYESHALNQYESSKGKDYHVRRTESILRLLCASGFTISKPYSVATPEAACPFQRAFPEDSVT